METGGGRKAVFITLLLALFLLTVRAAAADVAINEFLANGVAEPGSEWIELYNNGTAAVDITGWNITDGELNSNFTFPAFILEPGSFVLAVRDSAQFNATFNDSLFFNSSVTVFEYKTDAPGLQLANGGDNITLFAADSAATVQDSISFGAQSEGVSQGRLPDGNGSSDLVSFSRPTPSNRNDNIPPAINASLTPIENTTVTGTLTLVANITDNLYPIDTALVEINSINSTLAQAGDLWSFSWDTTLLPDGVYNLTFFANDTAGLSSSAFIRNVTVDNSRPNVTLSSPVDGSVLGGPLILNATVNDSSPIDTVFFNVSNATDTLIIPAAQSGGEFAEQLNTAVLNDGPYTAAVFANDTVNNTNSSQSAAFTVDNLKPNASINGPAVAPPVRGTVPLNATITDATALTVTFEITNASNGFNSTPALTGGEFVSLLDTTTLADGAYNFGVLAVDAAGNTNASEVTALTVDNTAPAVTINSPADGRNVTRTLTLNATVADAALDTVLFNISNSSGFSLLAAAPSGAEQAAALDTATLNDGAYTINVLANDTAGNRNATEAVTVTIDNTRPAVTINAPTAAANVSGTTLLNVTVTDASPLSVAVLNLSNATDALSTITVTGGNGELAELLDTTSLPDGTATLQVIANDTLNNTNATETVSFFIDNTPPAVTIITPPNGTNASGTLTLNATVTDALALSIVFFTVSNTTDLAAIAATPAGSEQSAALDTATLNDGSYVIALFANDTLNNTNSSQGATVVIDNTPPVITLGACTPDPANLTQAVTCNATITDNLVGIGTVQAVVTLPNSTNETQTLTFNGNVYQFTFTGTVLRGIYNVTWRANDTLNNSNKVVTNFTILNRAPEQNGTVPNLTWSEDTNITLNLSAFFTDADGDNLTFLNTSGPSLTTIFINESGLVTFEPPADFNGTDSVVFTVSDGFGGSNTTNNITLNVTQVNDAPTIAPTVPNITLAEDSGAFVLFLTQNEQDIEDLNGTGLSNGLSWAVINQNASLYSLFVFSTLDMLVFNTTLDAFGTDTIGLILTDSGGLSATQNLTVTITPVNDAPAIAPIPAQSVTEDTLTTLELAPFLSDADGGLASLVVQANSSRVLVNRQNLTFNYTDQAVTSEGIELNVTDGIANASRIFNITVTFVNDVPQFAGILLQTVAEDGGGSTLNLTPFISDEETAAAGLTLTLLSENASQVDCSVTSQTLNLTPAANFSGLAQCELQLSDGSAAASTNISINVTPVNDAVQLLSAIPNQTLTEDTPAVLNLTPFWFDADGDAIGYNVAAQGPNVTITLNNATRTATLQPAANFSGSTWMILAATDGTTSANSSNVSITVTAVNDEPPAVSAFPAVIFSEDSFNASINLSDFVADADTPDDQISWSKLGDPRILFSVLPGQRANFSAVPDFCGTTAILLTASDGNTTDSEPVTVQVNCVADAPVVNLTAPANGSTINSTTVTFSWTASDADNDTLSFTLHLGTGSNPPANLTTTATSATLSGLANNQLHFWRIVANDSTSVVSSPTRQFTVMTNLPPVITTFAPADTTPAVAEGSTLAFSVTATDPESAPLRFNWTLDGTQVSTTAAFTYAPGFSDAGAHTVLANVTDSVNNTATQQWNVTVTGTNTAPVINGTIPAQTLAEDGGTLTLDLTPFERDLEDGNAGLTWSVSGVDASLLTITINAATDEAAITPVANAFGSDTATFTLTDSGGLTASQNVLITVTAVNDPLTITSFSPSFDDPAIGDNETLVFSITAVDPDGTAPSITWFVNNALSGTGSTFAFTGTSLGAFAVRANVSDGSVTLAQEWDVTVSRAPILSAFDGSTTFNVTTMNDSQLASVSSFILERSGVARIVFTQPVDLRDAVDFGNLVIMQNNLVGIDTAALPELNRSARITLFNVNVNSPVILFNGGFTANTSAIAGVCDFCTIISSANNQIVFDVTHFTTFMAVPSTAADLRVPDSITIGGANAARNSTVNASFTITNPGTLASVASVQVSAVANSRYGIAFSLDGAVFTPTLSVGTIAPGSSATVFVRATIPANEDGGEHDIGDIVVSSPQVTKTIRNVLINPLSSLRIKNVEVDSDDLDSGGSADIEPGTSVDVEVEVENIGSEDMEDIEVEVRILDIRDGNRDIEEDADEFDLDAGDEETATVGVNIPDDLDEDSYDIIIEVRGVDDSGARHVATLRGELDVEKEDHDLRLSAELSAAEISCTRTPTVDVTVRNLGEDDEDDVRITATSSALGVSEEASDLDLDEGDRLHRSFALTLTQAREGSYAIDVRVYRDNNDLEDTASLPLRITACAEERSVAVDVAEQDIRRQHQELLSAMLAQQQPQIVVEQRDTGFFWVAVAIIIVINVGVIAFLTGAVVIRKQQKLAQQRATPGAELPARSVLEMRKMKEKEGGEQGKERSNEREEPGRPKRKRGRPRKNE